MAKNMTPIVDVAALAKIKWENEKARLEAFRDAGATPSAAGVWANITHGAFAYANVCRKARGTADTLNGNGPDAEACFRAYLEGRTRPGGPGALAKGSEGAYRTAITTAIEVAYELPDNYGADVLRDFIATECGKLSFGSRGAYMRNILAAHPTVVGTYDEMKECKPEGDPANLSDRLANIVKAMEAIAKDATLAAAIVSNGLADQFKATKANAEALASASAVKIAGKAKGSKAKPQSDETRALLSK